MRLNGRHLLQCTRLPAKLSEDRSQLIQASYPDLSLHRFALATTACVGARDDAGSPLLLFLAVQKPNARPQDFATRLPAKRLDLLSKPPEQEDAEAPQPTLASGIL